ncbi:MAG: hypothetical protein ACREEM_44000 [Blastocatellia bacterium]
MRRLIVVWGIISLVQLLPFSAFAQQDKLVGRWEGNIQAPQGERPTNAVFKKEGDGYTGKMPGMRPGTEVVLKDIKIDGNKVTAKSDIETPQATITVNYSFTLEGEAMKGELSADFGGQSMAFPITLKRVSADPASAPTALATAQNQAAGAGGGQQRQRVDVPQPQQKQSIDYFAGPWSYKYVGRESALGPAPRDCTVTFAKRADGKSVEGASDCNTDGGAFNSTTLIVWDEATKTLSFTEKLSNGVTLTSRGDWSSPISIRFAVEPVKTKDQSLQLRRTISIVAAHSFTVTEELSEDGGPFVRLGSAVYSKVGAK